MAQDNRPVVAVTAPEAVRIRRLTTRDGISQEYARNRISAQHSDAWFRERCDHTLVNDGEEELVFFAVVPQQ